MAVAILKEYYYDITDEPNKYGMELTKREINQENIRENGNLESEQVNQEQKININNIHRRGR